MADEHSDDEVLRAIEHDDGYVVDKLLADHDGCRTERAHRVEAPDQALLIKRIRRELANKDAWDVLATLESPRLPKVVDSYWLPDCLVVVCEWVEGESVADLVARRLRLDAPEVAAIVADVASALDCLHGAGLVHRDVTPGNVIVCGGRSWLIDLGIMRCHDDADSADTTRLGTYGFAPPEQFGFAQTDARSDVYSLARLAAYMLCGTDPGKDEAAFEMRLSDPALVSAPVLEVLKRAWSFEPSARFGGAGDFASAFSAAVSSTTHEGHAVAAEPDERQRTRRRGRRVAVAAIVAVVALAASITFMLLSSGRKTESSSESATSMAATTSSFTSSTTESSSGGGDGFYEVGQELGQSIALDAANAALGVDSQGKAGSELVYSVFEKKLLKDFEGKTVLALHFSWTNTTDETTEAYKCINFKYFQDGKAIEESAILTNQPEDYYEGIHEVRPGVSVTAWSEGVLTSESPVEVEIYDKRTNPQTLLESYTVDLSTVEWG